MLIDVLLAPPEAGISPGLEQLDSLSRNGRFHSGDHFWNLLLARLWAEQGGVRRALDAVRRRGQWGSLPKLQLPAFLREEGRLAALSADTTGAIRAYERYLELRSEPDRGPMQAQVDSVWTELEALRSRVN
jgi:hypothetical protein